MGSSLETSKLFRSHNTRQEKFVSKFVAREGLSDIPIQNRYLVPSCAHVRRLATFTPSHYLLNCFESFAWLRLSQYRSLMGVVTLTAHDQLFGNLKRQERQWAKMAPKCHRLTRRAGFQKATQLLSYIRYSMDTCQLTSPQGEADVWSLEGVWRCRRWGG
jgi:hypothetical protein